MGFNLNIGGLTYEALSFDVQEAATPLSAGDSSGQVGTLSFEIPRPDPDVQPNHPINVLGAYAALVKKTVRLDDSRKGFTLGRVSSVENGQSSGVIQVSAMSRLGSLNVYNVQAQPFVGTLSGAFTYYLSLAGVTSDFFIDPSIASKSVVFPGWNGDLWFNLKQLSAAQDCDISLVSGIIVLRPIRARVATRGRDLERSSSAGGGSLAQAVEIYQYNNSPITNKLVYPPGGWSEDVTVINVNAGETVEEVLELSASVSSITQPVMKTFVSKGHSSSSVFTVVGDDGFPIQPAAWSARGGSLAVTINPDTTSLTVRITAPTGLPSRTGEEIRSYGISLSSDNNTGRYSTLRIVGSGVAFDKELLRVKTGLTPAETATEVGTTIDNPFLSTRNEVISAASRAVRAFNGTSMTLTGTVMSVNQLGDTGSIVREHYADEAALHPGGTYASVQATYSGMTYQGVYDALNSGFEDLFEDQVFGNVAGARIWDRASARWYRIREAGEAPDVITFTAEDDLLHSDVQDFQSGGTYGSIQMRYNGRTYLEVDLMGLR